VWEFKEIKDLYMAPTRGGRGGAIPRGGTFGEKKA